jgi:hypothetical protein
MSDEQWSPARHPYAIAVSQAWWAFQARLVFAEDAKNAEGPRQQIYARQIFGQLRALRRCADMQTKELTRLGIPEADRLRLAAATAEFDAAVPAAKAGRDILEHFDDYARRTPTTTRSLKGRSSSTSRSRCGPALASIARYIKPASP